MSGLGDALVAQGVLTPDQLHEAEQRRHEYGGSLAKTLIQLQLADERSLLRGLASTMGMDYLDVDARSVDPSAAALVPAEQLEQLQALPVGFSDGDELLVAVSDPNRRDVAERIGQLTGLPVRLGLTSRAALAEAIAQHVANGGTATATNGRVAPSVDAAATGTVRTDGVPTPEASMLDELPIPPEAPSPTGRPAVADDLPLRVESEAPETDIDDLLVALFERGGSDLHLTVGTQPTIRINGDLTRLEEFPVLEPGELRKMIYAIMTSKQREVFENSLELDMSYSVPGLARFRVNVFQQRDSLGAVMRIIPFEILPLEDLGIPSQVAEFANLPRGFVLVTGPTGSGKSTTLASLIDMINRTRPVHIMTVEDPIEFLHDHKTSVVNQREVGTDTHGFADALKHALRQDPDVILVGELRDLETIQIALTAAETGHLVFGTLHTQDAPQTVDRIIDVFPPHQQEQIRVMLAGALQGVVCQTLLKRVDGEGRIAACEVMVTTSGIKNLIREGKTHQIYSSMQSGGQYGMVTMDQSLANLVRRGLVTRDAALEKAADVQEFERLASGA
jgi:twitching motility protein PilT